jgi:hypothetical protein
MERLSKLVSTEVCNVDDGLKDRVVQLLLFRQYRCWPGEVVPFGLEAILVAFVGEDMRRRRERTKEVD